jgi:threonyl-tRNA synthetase
MQARIRDAELQKVPAILVVGEKEQTTKTASLRIRNKAEVGLVDEQGLADAIKNLKI